MKSLFKRNKVIVPGKKKSKPQTRKKTTKEKKKKKKRVLQFQPPKSNKDMKVVSHKVVGKVLKNRSPFNSKRQRISKEARREKIKADRRGKEVMRREKVIDKRSKFNSRMQRMSKEAILLMTEQPNAKKPTAGSSNNGMKKSDQFRKEIEIAREKAITVNDPVSFCQYVERKKVPMKNAVITTSSMSSKKEDKLIFISQRQRIDQSIAFKNRTLYLFEHPENKWKEKCQQFRSRCKMDKRQNKGNSFFKDAFIA